MRSIKKISIKLCWNTSVIRSEEIQWRSDGIIEVFQFEITIMTNARRAATRAAARARILVREWPANLPQGLGLCQYRGRSTPRPRAGWGDTGSLTPACGRSRSTLLSKDEVTPGNTGEEFSLRNLLQLFLRSHLRSYGRPPAACHEASPCRAETPRLTSEPSVPWNQAGRESQLAGAGVRLPAKSLSRLRSSRRRNLRSSGWISKLMVFLYQ